MTSSYFHNVLHAVASAVSDSLWPHGLRPTRLLCAWDSPGKNTAVGCHAFHSQFLNPYFKFISPLLLKSNYGHVNTWSITLNVQGCLTSENSVMLIWSKSWPLSLNFKGMPPIWHKTCLKNSNHFHIFWRKNHLAINANLQRVLWNNFLVY